MKQILFLIPLFLFGLNFAYAEPFDGLEYSVLDYNQISATIHMNWNNDAGISQYQVGCVSCMPNTFEVTSVDEVSLSNISPFPNSSVAMLYILAYDYENDIIAAKQIFVDLS